MVAYKNIAFGHASAEAERTEDPGLLIDGYVDYNDATNEALSGRKYLFLGHKGAGKSAIAERINLTYSDDFDKFVTLVSLADFPFTPFSKIIRGDEEPETKFPTAWSWIILIYLLETFANDEGVSSVDGVTITDTIQAFREMGLSPAADPASIVRESAKKHFKLSLPGKLAQLSWSGSETKPASQIPNFVESLKQLVKSIRSSSQHYLIIDGLDDVLTTREIQYKSLSALILEVSRLNSMFNQSGVPAKIILLCRTDLFELLPGPNNNKIRQDYSLELNWYSDPRDPQGSELVGVAERRTKRSLGTQVEMFRDFFPSTIEGRRADLALLDMTRHTPRDFLRLLSHIQQYSQNEGVNPEKTIISGIRNYSIQYFLPEIRDELSGYADPNEISSLVSALGRLGKRDFRLSELISVSKAMNASLSEIRIYEIVGALFQCSALGNIEYNRNGTTYYTFKYRNRYSSFNDQKNIMLHRGLWKALNLTR